MKRNRHSVGRTPTGNPFRKPRWSLTLTEHQKQKCKRCGQMRYRHERQGIIPDHKFVEPEL